MRRLLLFFVIFSALVSCAEAQTLNVKLTLNNVENRVYIPGIGEMPSDSLGPGTIHSSPEHFYIASYLNNIMYTLVGATGINLYGSSDATSHTIQLNQNLQDSRVFLGFTKGDWNSVENVIEPIESGSFLQEIAPSISFGLGYLNPIKILLEYTGINITGEVVLHSGFRKLTISNEGFGDNMPVIRIESP